jgi:hypothetical protein
MSDPIDYNKLKRPTRSQKKNGMKKFFYLLKSNRRTNLLKQNIAQSTDITERI